MTVYEKTAVIISLFALIASIGTAFYSYNQQNKLASIDFKAKEMIKSDTAKLLSTMRSIMYKGVLIRTEGYKLTDVDISSEQSFINDFLNSESSLAYHSWVNEKDLLAKNQGEDTEGWRTFFIDLAAITSTDNPYYAAERAAEIELLFDNFTEEDISKIAEYNSDLNKAISENSKNRKGNPIAAAFIERAIERNKEHSPKNVLGKLTYLKGIGINDPNIDMFIAVFENNTSKLKVALSSGANVSTTDSALLKKYSAELENYGNT